MNAEAPNTWPRPCVECGEVFRPKTYRSRFCTKRCKGRCYSREQYARLCALQGKSVVPRKPRENKQCFLCGAEFKPSNNTQMFCSRSCGAKSRRVNGPLPYDPARPVQKYDAEKAREFYQRNRESLLAKVRERRGGLKPLDRTCPQCGKAFVAEGKQIYCARNCCKKATRQRARQKATA